MKCLNCGKDFNGRADAKFDSASCRKQYSRRVTDNHVVTDNVTDNTFTPNWQRKDFLHSKEEAIRYILACLGDNPSHFGEVFYLGRDVAFEVTKKGIQRIA